jgi:hypothetical protein
MQRGSDARFQVQYVKSDIPGYFAYAQQFMLCDNYFSEVAGPSTPNHLMLICADAPIINNPAHHYNPRPGDGYELSSLPLQLEKAGFSWGNYGTGSMLGHGPVRQAGICLEAAEFAREPCEILPDQFWSACAGRTGRSIECDV